MKVNKNEQRLDEALGILDKIDLLRLLVDARRWARKLYADNARLRDQNEFLTGLIKSHEWYGKDDVGRYCLRCGNYAHYGRHSPDCPAFNTDGSVK